MNKDYTLADLLPTANTIDEMMKKDYERDNKVTVIHSHCPNPKCGGTNFHNMPGDDTDNNYVECLDCKIIFIFSIPKK